MADTITINTITGSSDYDVWLSNGCADTEVKVYIDTISDSDVPYTFNIPDIYKNTGFCVKIYDDNNCKICECFGVAPSPSPSPTPTNTPSATVTPSMTPTPTPTPTCPAPTYLYGSFTGNGFTATATYTLSTTLYNNKNQWESTNNGTLRWINYRWEISGWSLGGVTFHNQDNTTINAPNTTDWVYQGCALQQTCGVVFTQQGCGPL